MVLEYSLFTFYSEELVRLLVSVLSLASNGCLSTAACLGRKSLVGLLQMGDIGSLSAAA